MSTAGKNLSEYDKSQIPDAKDLRIGVVVSEWNAEITERLFQGAKETFLDCGGDSKNLVRWDVPGSFELVHGCKRMSESIPRFDAIIAIGCVIQGETKHFDFVCEGVTQGLKDLNVLGDIPVIFCVLTDNDIQQSLDRSGGKHGNKGSEAVVAGIKMAYLGK